MDDQSHHIAAKTKEVPSEAHPLTHSAIKSAFERGDFRLARLLLSQEETQGEEAIQIRAKLQFDMSWLWIGLSSAGVWVWAAWSVVR